MSDVTVLLERIEKGESNAAADLLPRVYSDLRQVAAAKMAKESPGQTLQPTALVHEAYLRLVGQEDQRWENSRHFFSAAAEAMRRILVERARKRARQKRGGGLKRLDIERITVASEDDDETVLFVDEGLERLASKDPTCAELIKLRFFAGLSNHEAAKKLGLTERTAKRNWAYAKAWLAAEIKRLQSGAGE